MYMKCRCNYICLYLCKYYIYNHLYHLDMKVKSETVSCSVMYDSVIPWTIACQETWVWSLGWEDPLEKGKATHFSILAWRFPCTVHPWGHTELYKTERLSLSSYLSHLFLNILGLGLHQSFTMKLGEVTSRQKARFPFKSRILKINLI